MSTIQQVAHVAKVSVATVSRVINNSANVSLTTRKRVEDAIAKLNYQPNAMGSLLRKDRTNMVLVLVHDFDNPFFSAVVKGIEKKAHEHHYNVLICTTYGSREREQHYIKMLQHHFVDGVILVSNSMTLEEINQLNALYPVVQAIEYIQNSNAPYYSVDYYTASFELIESLIRKGRKQIAFVHAGLTHIVSNHEKYRGYRDALKKHGYSAITMNLEDEYIFDLSSGKALTSLLLDQNPTIDAFMVTSDLPGLGILAELRERGKRVPEDVSVVSFDNTVFSTLNQPELTSVDLNTYDVGIQAMDRVLSRIDKRDQDLPLGCMIPYTIIERESS